MTILEAVQNVAGEAGYQIDTRALLSTDITTVKLVKIAQRVLYETAVAHAWTKFYASGSITVVGGQAEYQLPAAFDHQIYDSFWNKSTRWRLVGPISEQEYAAVQGYGLNSSIYKRYLLRGCSDSRLTLTPTPGATEAGDNIIFEYTAARYARPRSWAAGLSIAAAGEYIFNDGRYYTATGAGTTGATPPIHIAGTVSDGGVSWTYYAGRYTTFLADTDEPIIPQRLMELGMLERFDERHDLNVASRYLDQMSREIAKDKPGRILYAGGDRSRVMAAKDGRATFGTTI